MAHVNAGSTPARTPLKHSRGRPTKNGDRPDCCRSCKSATVAGIPPGTLSIQAATSASGKKPTVATACEVSRQRRCRGSDRYVRLYSIGSADPCRDRALIRLVRLQPPALRSTIEAPHESRVGESDVSINTTTADSPQLIEVGTRLARPGIERSAERRAFLDAIWDGDRIPSPTRPRMQVQLLRRPFP